MSPELLALLDMVAQQNGPVVALTGAGISAESGIPTFRGEEGYWTAGSRVYRPTELATNAMYQSHPDRVWPWYLYRRAICQAAHPNPGHKALVRLEEALGDRFLLVTQNVDGLHLRAGNRLDRTYQIHGNIDYFRCEKSCQIAPMPLPAGLEDWPRERLIDDAVWETLQCPRCQGPTRPHVLWFDECYDETLYHFESSLQAAARASLLLIVGTSGATNLPNQMVSLAARSGAAVIDINPNSNPFSQLAEQLPTGYAARGTSGDLLPAIVERLVEGG